MNALSRKVHVESEETNAVSTVVPKWLEIVAKGYSQDPEEKELLTVLSLVESNDGATHWVKG